MYKKEKSHTIGGGGNASEFKKVLLLDGKFNNFYFPKMETEYIKYLPNGQLIRLNNMLQRDIYVLNEFSFSTQF